MMVMETLQRPRDRHGLALKPRKTVQSVVNGLVHNLKVRCLGVDGHALVFERTDGGSSDPGHILSEIKKRLVADDTVREALKRDDVTTLTLRA